MDLKNLLVVATVTISVLAISQGGSASETKAGALHPTVLMDTSLGLIKIELWADKAPTTVENFLRYVDERFYDGTVFHRVISGFMIQGGGFMPDMGRKNTHEPIRNEASPQLKNDRGTVAMARTPDIHSATSQFFINLVDNDSLNHRDDTPRGYGYAVFGRVIEGMDIVEKIGRVKTVTRGPFRDVPEQPVVIRRVRRLDAQ
jgi:cyclophilin family peptidyl-prolyl cis-trans isomerase